MLNLKAEMEAVREERGDVAKARMSRNPVAVRDCRGHRIKAGNPSPQEKGWF